jgi:hypothetical protein
VGRVYLLVEVWVSGGRSCTMAETVSRVSSNSASMTLSHSILIE